MHWGSLAARQGVATKEEARSQTVLVLVLALTIQTRQLGPLLARRFGNWDISLCAQRIHRRRVAFSDSFDT